MRAFLRTVDRINRLLELLVGLALVAMTCLIFIQILVRFVFAKLGVQLSVPWTEELSRYCMIWAIFVGAAVVTRKADSLAVEALVQAVPPSAGRFIKYCAHGIAMAFYGCVAVVGWEWAEFGLSETAPVLGMPMVWVYSAMSVGAVFTLVNAVALLVETRLEGRDILEVIDTEAEEAVAELHLANAKRS